MYKVCMVSLGCPKNQVDAEMMLSTLKNAGLEMVTISQCANLTVNT